MVKTIDAEKYNYKPNEQKYIYLVIILFGLFIFNIYYKPKKNYDNVIFSDL